MTRMVLAYAGIRIALAIMLFHGSSRISPVPYSTSLGVPGWDEVHDPWRAYGRGYG